MTDLYPTMTRRALLVAISARRVVVGNGYTMWRKDTAFHGRCEARVREAVAAGWTTLGADGCTYELTDAGRAVLKAGAQ